MMQGKNIRVGLALSAALSGLGMCGTASALPEVDVGTLPPIVAPSSVDTVDSTVAVPDEVDTDDSAS